MPSSLRLARLDVSRYRLLATDFDNLQALHQELTLTIRRHLPEVTASLLALPVPCDDGTSVDWFSDLAGEARPLTALPAAQRKLIKAKLEDRLRSLRRLADELPRRVRGSEALAERLVAATHYPGDEQVYVVGNEPVITLWGFVRSGGRGRLAAPGVASQQKRLRSRGLVFGAAVLALIAVTLGTWLWLTLERDQALRAEIAAALAAGCADTDRLAMLAHRAEQRDPNGQRFGDLHAKLEAEQAACAEARVLAEAARTAGWDCAALASVASRLATVDISRAPLDALSADVAERQRVCALAQQLGSDLDRELGDCVAMATLAERSIAEAEALGLGPRLELAKLPEPMARVRERIKAELTRCDEAARLDQALVAASAQCDLLLRLDGRLAELDVSRPPLQSLRERLDAELALCARAEAFSRDLIDAQMDCQRILALDQQMQGDDMRRPPLQSVRERLDEAVEACRALDALEQARLDAKGDCQALAGLVESISAGYGGNLLFVSLRRRIAADTDRCALAERLRAALAAATGNCTALTELQPRIASAALAPEQLAPEQLAPLNKALQTELGLCRDAEDWRARLAAAAEDCERLAQLRASWPESVAGAAQFRQLGADLARLEQRCRLAQPPPPPPSPASSPAPVLVAAETEPAVAKPDAATPQPSSPKTAAPKASTPACPGVRAVSEAPQLVMVVDASGSMRESIAAQPEALRQLEQIGGSVGATIGLIGRALETASAGPTRMQATKEAGQRIIRGLPDDIDVGLVKIENCPSATDAGFYSPAQRGALLARINALRPRAKTPLASAIERAAAMVDGSGRPALIVVISDGEDTCGGNVCAVAARIAAAKPQLKINVVDITGAGAADCAARATGGRVLRADNAQDLGAQLVRATEEVAGPAHCRGG